MNIMGKFFFLIFIIWFNLREKIWFLKNLLSLQGRIHYYTNDIDFFFYYYRFSIATLFLSQTQVAGDFNFEPLNITFNWSILGQIWPEHHTAKHAHEVPKLDAHTNKYRPESKEKKLWHLQIIIGNYTHIITEREALPK